MRPMRTRLLDRLTISCPGNKADSSSDSECSCFLSPRSESGLQPRNLLSPLELPGLKCHSADRPRVTLQLQLHCHFVSLTGFDIDYRARSAVGLKNYGRVHPHMGSHSNYLLWFFFSFFAFLLSLVLCFRLSFPSPLPLLCTQRGSGVWLSYCPPLLSVRVNKLGSIPDIIRQPNTSSARTCRRMKQPIYSRVCVKGWINNVPKHPPSQLVAV